MHLELCKSEALPQIWLCWGTKVFRHGAWDELGLILLCTNLYEVNTSLIGSCSKATHISNDPSTKSNERAVAI